MAAALALTACLCYGVSNALGVAAFYRAASLGPLSVAAPIGATAAIMPVAIGVAGGESLTAGQLAGIVLAVGGVVLAARRESTPVPRGGVRGCALPKLALPGVLLFAGTVTYTQATAEGQLSVVSVLSSLFPVVTVALAFGLLGERL